MGWHFLRTDGIGVLSRSCTARRPRLLPAGRACLDPGLPVQDPPQSRLPPASSTRTLVASAPSGASPSPCSSTAAWGRARFAAASRSSACSPGRSPWSAANAGVHPALFAVGCSAPSRTRLAFFTKAIPEGHGCTDARNRCWHRWQEEQSARAEPSFKVYLCQEGRYARMSRITLPDTSVRRWSRPL